MRFILKNSFRFFIIFFIQVFILSKVPPLHQFIVPYFYFILILWLPFRTSRTSLLFYGFVLGMIVDMFYKTPGLHTAASLLIAFMRPYIINLLLPKEVTEWGDDEPSRFSMGALPYSTYILFLTLLHNGYLILLEWIQFGSFLYFIGKLIGTSVVSLLLILITELFVHRKTRSR